MSDYLDQVEAQLTELTEKGAHQRFRARRGALGRSGGAGGPRPPRRGSEVLAFLAAAAVVVAVVAIVVFNAHSSSRHINASSAAHSHANSTPKTPRPNKTSTTTPHTASTSVSTVQQFTPGRVPIPAHFAPQSFTATGELTWWLLGQAQCTLAGLQPPCGAILRTTDGGQHFSAIEAPRATVSTDGTSPASGYSQIRFADTKNGFAYGPGLYATHNAGQSWHSVDVAGAVRDLEISNGEAYAIVTAGTTNAGQLMHSPVGQDDWTTVAAAGQVAGGLWVLGHEVLVQSASGGGFGTDVLVSTDGGASFATRPAPSAGLPCYFQAQSPPVIWARCATGMDSGVWRSADGGASFSPAVGSGTHLMLPNSAVFGAASDTTAVVGYQQLYRTADAGATWIPVGPSRVAQWAYLGFTDATHGVALGYVGQISPANERLYYTTDGGQSYHLVPMP